MKTAFISDIHGNAIALEAVLRDVHNKRIDKIVVLGDLCYRGPEPARSLDIIRSLNCGVIKGNADEWVIRGIHEGEVPNKVLELMNIERDWTVSQLKPSDINYLENLPSQLFFEINGIVINTFHATPTSLFDVVPPDANDQLIEANLMQYNNAQIYVYAHIHKPYIRYINEKVIMNIGSVGLPFDGTVKASYGVIEVGEGGTVSTSIARVPYDVESVVKLYKETKYPNMNMMIEVIQKARI